MANRRVMVTLDETNDKAVQIVADRLHVSLSKAVNILIREGLEYSATLVRSESPNSGPASAARPRRVPR